MHSIKPLIQTAFMKLTSIASGLALSFLCLTPSISEAAPKPYKAIQRAATDITIEATRLGHVINSLQRLLDVIPDGLYLPKKNQRDMIPPILGATATLTASLDFIDGQVVYMRTAAIASGAEGHHGRGRRTGSRAKGRPQRK